MSNFIAWGGGGGSGSTLTCTVKSPQSSGATMIFGAGYVTGSSAQRYVTGVTDSKGGTWVSDATRIGENTATDNHNGGNTLSSGPTFKRTDALGTNDLRPGDTITTTWNGSCTKNIFVAAQLGGILETVPNRWLVNSFGSITGPIDPYTDNHSAADTNGFGVSTINSWDSDSLEVHDNLGELITFVAMQPGNTGWLPRQGTLIDMYVSDYTGPGATPGSLSIAATQVNVHTYTSINPGGQVPGTGFPQPKIILDSYQIYDDPLFFNSSPGPASLGVSASPPLFMGTVKSKKH